MTIISNLKRFAQIHKVLMTDHFNEIQELAQIIKKAIAILILCGNRSKLPKISFEIEKEIKNEYFKKI